VSNPEIDVAISQRRMRVERHCKRTRATDGKLTGQNFAKFCMSRRRKLSGMCWDDFGSK
jgi:hypothetical protein